MNWKKGRGKLGIFAPLMGTWVANAGSQDRTQPPVTRAFTKILNGKYIQLDVTWDLGDKSYLDHTLIGVTADKEIGFWSFTSDGKNSHGRLADVSDLHPDAIGFEAQMPAGLARQAYWPHEEAGFYWVVESKTKKGWNRFVKHHYLPK